MTHFDRQELLSKLGLEEKPSAGQALVAAIAPFGLGLLVGAVAALLLAPKSGRELREDLRSTLSGDGLPDEAEPEAGDGGFEPGPRPA
jgi:uncharacterized membrane protein YebE (DUF533 family)